VSADGRQAVCYCRSSCRIEKRHAPRAHRSESGHHGGKPIVRGTRIPVELILRKLGAGMPPESILVDHPRLTHDDIRAAQAFAADDLADEDIFYG
jgi:uncharacterized protein (DUF433 family)